MREDEISQRVRDTWRHEYAQAFVDGEGIAPGKQRFALTDKERFEVDEIIKERLNALDWPEIIEFKRKLWQEIHEATLKTTAEAAITPTPSQAQDGDSEELVESIRVRTRRRYWERRWDQGWMGHAYGGTKDEWVNTKLTDEGYL